jgi:DNA-binding SARP family transcriptional activator
MEFRLLGPLEVVGNNGPLPLRGAKQRALLALLLLHANETLPRDRLIDELWGESPPATAPKALQVYVSQLRKLLEPRRVLETTPTGYLLRLAPGQLDLDRFDSLRIDGRAALADCDAAEAARLFAEALSLWRGPALADLAYEPFAQTEIARLEDLRLAALEGRIEAELRLGRHAELTGELEALAAEHPLREHLRGLLMLALYRAGRQAEALEAYQDARRILVEELGIEPGRKLRDLEQAILRQDPVLDLAPALPRARTGAKAQGAFVGRERELEALLTGFEGALAGRGGLYLIVGEPGIGKSRLTEELVSRARERGAQVLVGRCWEAGGAPAYWPWVQALRACVRAREPEQLGEELGSGAPDLAPLVPEIRELLPDVPKPEAPESADARFRLFEAAASFLKSVADERPLVLVLDDLHAADEPSLLLLQFLARELAESRLLVVAAYRDVNPILREPLTATLSELGREPVTHRLALAGLAEAAVAEYIEDAAGRHPSEALVEAIHAETEGNPLFVGEVVRLLSIEDVRPQSAAQIRLAIPQTVHDVIMRRLAHLSEECKRVLVFASVIGREFRLDALARLSGLDEDELLETLDEAMASRILADTPGAPSELRFAHILIRDVLYEGLTTPRRLRVHRLAIEALENLHGAESGPHLAELAHHAIAGGDFEKALACAQRAGDRALELLAYEEAARLYRVALEALDVARPDDEQTRCELLLSLGEAQIRVGETPTAKETFTAAAAIARRAGLARALARAAYGYGGRIVWVRAGEDTRLVPLLEEALTALPDEDLELRSRLLARLAGALRDEHSRGRREALSTEAVVVARASGSSAAVAYALDAQAYATIAPDTMGRCLELARELRAAAEQAGDKERVVASHMLASQALLVLGDVPAAETEMDAAGRAADELKQGAQLALVEGERAMLALAKGRLDESERLANQKFELAKQALPGASVATFTCQRYMLRDLRWDLGGMESEIAELAADAPARPVFRCVLAHVHARLGAKRRGQTNCPGDNARGCGGAAVRPGVALRHEPPRGSRSADQGRGRRGRAISSALTMGHAQCRRRCRGLPRHRLALSWSARGDPRALERGRGPLRARSRGERTHGLPPWLAQTQDDYARMLLARDGSGDRTRAAHLFERARSTYRELGMETYEARAAATMPTP